MSVGGKFSKFLFKNDIFQKNVYFTLIPKNSFTEKNSFTGSKILGWEVVFSKDVEIMISLSSDFCVAVKKPAVSLIVILS